MPDEVAFDIESGLDECDVTGVADDGIFATCFTGFRWQHGDRCSGGIGHGCHIRSSTSGNASHDFERHLMQMDGVSIHREVVNLPCFHGIECGGLCGGVHPPHGHRHVHLHYGIEGHGSQQSLNRPIECRTECGAHFIERDFSGDCGGW